MPANQAAPYADPQFAAPPVRRSRTRPVWSADQFLDPLALAVAAPLVLFPERFPREAFLVAATLLAVPYAVRLSNRGRLSAPIPLAWPLLLLLAVILPLNVWRSSDFWAVSWPEAVRFVWGAAVLMGVANWCATDTYPVHHDGAQSRIGAHIAVALVAYFALGLAFSAVGLLALQASNKVPLLADLAERIPGLAQLPLGLSTGFNANRVAGLAVLFVPLTLALLISPNRTGSSLAAMLPLKAALLLSLAFFGGLLLLTQSRGALLAAAVAVVLVSLLAGRRGWLPLALLVLMALAALDVFGAGGLVDAFAVQDEAGAVEGGLWQRITADRNVAGRVVIWQRALHGIADEPLTGMGLAEFQRRAQQAYPPMPQWQPDPDITHAHNLFLQTALDLGLPGLAALLALLALVLRDATALFLGSRPDSPARFLAIGLAGALAAFLVYNMLDAMTVGARPAVSYWYLFGLTGGAATALRVGGRRQ